MLIALLILLIIPADQFTVVVEQSRSRFKVNVIQETVKKPVLYVTSATFNCPPCKRLEADIEAGFFEGIEIRKAPAWPGMKGYPSIRFRDQQGKWKSVTGYDAEIRVFLLGVSSRDAKPEQSSKQSATSTVRRMTHKEMRQMHDAIHNAESGRNTTWGWTGDLEKHLRTSHGVESFEVEILK
jgi:hypothetical protein